MLQSLRTSHQARCALLNDQIGASSNSKIRRLKESELVHADDDCQERVEQLGRRAESADIHTTLVVQGTRRVSRAEVA